jgi:hypothetical protein
LAIIAEYLIRDVYFWVTNDNEVTFCSGSLLTFVAGSNTSPYIAIHHHTSSAMEMMKHRFETAVAGFVVAIF